MNTPLLHTPIEYLKGVGSAKGEILKKELGVFNFGDLVNYYPFRYIDRTKFFKINEIDVELPYIQILVRLKSFEILGEKTKNDDPNSEEEVWIPIKATKGIF